MEVAGFSIFQDVAGNYPIVLGGLAGLGMAFMYWGVEESVGQLIPEYKWALPLVFVGAGVGIGFIITSRGIPGILQYTA